MFAPLALASRAASKARERTSDTLKVASHLAEEVRGEGTNGSGGSGGVLDEIDHLNSEEAEDRLEDEYQPLMEAENQDDEEDDENENEETSGGTYDCRGGGRTTGRKGKKNDSQRNRGKQNSIGDGQESLEVKTRSLELFIAYIIFFILGASILLAWNSEIVAGVYFGSRLKGSKFEFSYSNFVALTFTTSNLLFLAYANLTQQGANLGRRIWLSIVVLIVVIGLYTGSTQIEEINAYVFFAFLIVSTITLAASASYLQNSIVALSSKFGPSCLQGILSGQGAIALAVALIQFISAYASFQSESAGSSFTSSTTSSILELSQMIFIQDEQKKPSMGEKGPIPSPSLRNSAFAFFLAIGCFGVIALLSYVVLLRLPLYRLVMRSLDTDEEEGESDSDEEEDRGRPRASSSTQKNGKSDTKHKETPSLRVIEKKVRMYSLAMFLTFGVTLSVFPSITGTVQSVNRGPGKDIPAGFSGTLTHPALFSPLTFMAFALGDWIGRVLPQVKALNFTSWKALLCCSIVRIVFVPLFLNCNTLYANGTPLINSDIAFLLIMLIFSLSNGYISTLIMLATVVDPSLEEYEVDTAATCVAFFLTAGLAIGSFASFPVRAIVCHCNPFT